MFKTGTKVRNSLTGETATVSGTKDFWITSRGWVTKVSVKDGDHSKAGQEKFWMPSSLVVIEDALPAAYVRFNHLVDLLDNTDSNLENKVLEGLNCCWVGLRQKLLKDNTSNLRGDKRRDQVFKVSIILTLCANIDSININLQEAMKLQTEILALFFEDKK